MKSIDSHIELLKEQFDSVGTKFNGLTWDRIKASHESFTQQYIESFDAIDAMKNDRIKDLQQSNKELVEMLEDIRNRMEVGVSSYEQVETALTEIITKYNNQS